MAKNPLPADHNADITEKEISVVDDLSNISSSMVIITGVVFLGAICTKVSKRKALVIGVYRINVSNRIRQGNRLKNKKNEACAEKAPMLSLFILSINFLAILIIPIVKVLPKS